MTPGGTPNDPHFWRLFRRFGGFGKKGPKKICFLRGRFFMIFWMAKKVVPRGHARHWLFKKPGPGLPGGFRGMNKDNPSARCLTRPWVDDPANFPLFHLLLLTPKKGTPPFSLCFRNPPPTTTTTRTWSRWAQ